MYVEIVVLISVYVIVVYLYWIENERTHISSSLRLSLDSVVLHFVLKSNIESEPWI